MNITIPKIPEKTLALPSWKSILKGVLVVMLARAKMGGMAPFGIAFAATLSPTEAYLGLLGLATGGSAYVKYIVSYIIYYILSRTGKAGGVFLGISVLISGGVSMLWTGTGVASAIYAVTEAILCGGAYMLFDCMKNPTPAGRFAAVVMVGAVLSGISEVVIPYIGVNAATFAAIFISMIICYSCTPSVAVFACAALGFVMSAADSNAVFVCGGFAVSAALASLLADMGKFALSVGFLCGVTVTMLYKGNLSGVNLADIFVPITFFALMPNGLLCKIGNAINDRFDTEAEDCNKSHAADKLRTVANALSSLSDGLCRKTDTEDNIKNIIETVSSRICRDCSLYESCWKTDAKKSYEAMYGIWKTMEKDGFCDHTNMPSRLRQGCIRLEGVLCEFRHACELAKQSTLLSGEAGADRCIMAKQYGEIANVLEILSREIEEEADEPEQSAINLSVRVTVASQPKPGNIFCGDTVTHFQRGNSYFVVLCDGMGSGESAKNQSRLTAKLFEEFLKAGFEKERAVSMINSALALKSDRESFSTADILEVDLENGIADFLKIGSAQSLIKSKNEIRVVSSKSLPIGILEQVDAVCEQQFVAPGDVILMLSDGIGEAGSGIMKNEWIKKLLLLENRNDEELTRMILSGASARTRYCDDMTCCVVRIKK